MPEIGEYYNISKKIKNIGTIKRVEGSEFINKITKNFQLSDLKGWKINQVDYYGKNLL